MPWSVTGWSRGPRQPLSYNLRAGQFRGMGTVRSYGNNIFINNNYRGFSGYDYGCTCNYSSTPKWMNWMMGIGLGTSFLGNILNLFGIGGGGSVEGSGGTETKAKTDAQAEADKNCTNIKTLFGDDVKGVVYMNKQYTARLKDGTILNHSDPNSLIELIKNHLATKPEKPATPDGKKEAKQEPETPATKPNLFNSATMSSLSNTEDVLNKFKTNTKSDAVKIEDVKASGITISLLVDRGITNGDKSVNITLNQSQLSDLASVNDKTINLSPIGNKSVSARNIDGYISIKIGDQDYIIGKANNKYQGFQYGNMNGKGYGQANWTNKNK